MTNLEFFKLLSSLGDPRSIKIINALSEGAMMSGGLTQACGAKQFNQIRRIVGSMCDIKLIEKDKKGLYHLNSDVLEFTSTLHEDWLELQKNNDGTRSV